jgi:hypothetical protein
MMALFERRRLHAGVAYCSSSGIALNWFRLHTDRAVYSSYAGRLGVDPQESRGHLLLAFEEAEFEADEASRRGKLTFAVVGGGTSRVLPQRLI